MSNQESSVPQLFAQLAKRLEAIQQQVAKALSQVDWQGIAQRLQQLPDEGKRIGSAGWTLPMWATPAEVSHILQAATERHIDDVFLDYYEADGGANYRQLKSDLLSRESLVRWRLLIEQCFTAFEHDLYLVVVPAMITVVEGAIAAIGGTDAWRRKDPKQTARKLLGRSPTDSVKRVIWSSVDLRIAPVRATLVRRYAPPADQPTLAPSRARRPIVDQSRLPQIVPGSRHYRGLKCGADGRVWRFRHSVRRRGVVSSPPAAERGPLAMGASLCNYSMRHWHAHGA